MESTPAAADHFQQFLLICQAHLLRLYPKILDHLLILQGILIIRLRAELSPLYHIYLLCHLSILNLKSVFSQSMHVYIDIYILLYPEIIASLFRKH